MGNDKSALEYSISVSDKVRQICEPLFSNFGITFFAYSHFLSDGSYLDLSTDKQWQNHYFEHFATSPFVKSYIQNIYNTNTKYVLWDNRPDIHSDKTFSRFIIDSCNFNIWHGFSIYERSENSLEVWHFATVQENFEIVNFYLNRLDLLGHFLLYVKEKAAAFIDLKDRRKLIVFADRAPLNSQNGNVSEGVNIEVFKEQTTIKRFSLNTKQGKIILSKREAECISLLKSNKTIKEIAKDLLLSPRTIESYLNNIKKKTGCITKSDLFELFNNNYVSYINLFVYIKIGIYIL